MSKAIETVYKGYRFRSRLEARWAVFFDTLGIEYDYEVEGFDLGEYGWYLPDFWFPHPVTGLADDGWGIWGEIKPRPLNDLETKKVEALCSLTGHNVLAIQGKPWEKEYEVSKWKYWGHEKYNPDILCELIMIKGMFANRGYENIISICGYDSSGQKEMTSYPTVFNNRLQDAYTAARQARFEFGENGELR